MMSENRIKEIMDREKFPVIEAEEKNQLFISILKGANRLDGSEILNRSGKNWSCWFAWAATAAAVFVVLWSGKQGWNRNNAQKHFADGNSIQNCRYVGLLGQYGILEMPSAEKAGERMQINLKLGDEIFGYKVAALKPKSLDLIDTKRNLLRLDIKGEITHPDKDGALEKEFVAYRNNLKDEVLRVLGEPDDEGMAAYEKLFSQLEGLNDRKKELYDRDKVQIKGTDVELTGDSYIEKWSNGDTNSLDYFETIKPVIEEYMKLSDNYVYTTYTGDIDFDTPATHIPNFRKLTFDIIIYGKVLERKDQYKDALKVYLSGLRLSRDLKKGIIVDALVGIAIRKMLDTAIVTLLRKGVLEAEWISTAINALEATRLSPQDIQFYVKLEMTGGYNAFEHFLKMEQGAGVAGIVKDPMFVELPEEWKKRMLEDPEKTAKEFLIQERAIYREWMDKYCEIVGQHKWPEKLEESKKWEKDIGEFQKDGSLGRLTMMLIPALKTILQKLVADEIKLRGAVIACGLEKYKLLRGKYPDNLEDLRGPVFHQVPTDPLTEENFHYRKTENGYNLYSYGLNLKDDGGNDDSDDVPIP